MVSILCINFTHSLQHLQAYCIAASESGTIAISPTTHPASIWSQSERKGQLLSKDSQPAIYLEVIIPRIVSPISQPTSPDQHPDATGLQADVPANEAIGLTTLGSSEPPRSLQRKPARETIEQAST